MSRGPTPYTTGQQCRRTRAAAGPAPAFPDRPLTVVHQEPPRRGRVVVNQERPLLGCPPPVTPEEHVLRLPRQEGLRHPVEYPQVGVPVERPVVDHVDPDRLRLDRPVGRLLPQVEHQLRLRRHRPREPAEKPFGHHKHHETPLSWSPSTGPISSIRYL